ncbi:MAG: hydroxymethylpyrimidine/phosphomethylpyrimidine kinase [Planctomycetes bacterium]|nr:hydroxymethylpyrimidine/phosphomethylpyrimidine kinase [Planctomycetota bacterium]
MSQGGAAAPRVLVIGGLDPSNGAGITADARAVQAHGGHALTVATGLTVQNRHGYRGGTAVAPDLLRAQLRAALAEGPVLAVKTGLFLSPDQPGLVAAELLAGLGHAPPWVVDPVLSATAGGLAGGAELIAALRAECVPRAHVVTPNLPELEALAPAGAHELLAAGARAVLVKGGHGAGDEVVDVLHGAGGPHRFAHPRLGVGPVHGTGCALASAIAAGLAHGREVRAACAVAIGWLQRCLRATVPAGDGLPVPLVHVALDAGGRG